MRWLLVVSALFCLAASIRAAGISITEPTDGSTIQSGTYVIRPAITSSVPVRRVDYFINAAFAGSATNPPFTFTNKSVAGNYRLRARAVDQSFIFTDSAPVYLKVSNAPTRLAFGPYLQSGSSTSIVVRWQTDWFSDAVIRYGTNLLALNLAVTNFDVLVDHEFRITGLEPNTKYFYSIGSTTNVLASGSSYYFRTAPRGSGPFRFWLVGDSGTADVNAMAVRESYYDDTGLTHTDAMLMLGDNAYSEHLPDRFKVDVFNIYAALLRHTPVWPTIGNHDLYDSVDGDPGPYLEAFTLPTLGESGGVPPGTESYYSYDYGNVHFVCLDSFVSDRATNSPMLNWLRTDLANTDKDWIIAYWHNPPYSFASHHSDAESPAIEMRSNVLPILEEYGTDLVFTGHNHDYERSFLVDGHYGFSWELEPEMVLNTGLGHPDDTGPYRKPAGGLGSHCGTVYTVCGCSGAGGGSDDGIAKHPVIAVTRGGYGSMILEVNGLHLTAKFLRSTGEIGDYFTIDKSSDTTKRPTMEIVRGTNAHLISWPTSKPAFQLEGASQVPATNWQPVGISAVTNGRRNMVTLSNMGNSQFFRLKRP